jgi:hypothetical protein
MIAIVTAISLILQVNSGNVYPRIEVTDQLTPRLTIRQSALSELQANLALYFTVKECRFLNSANQDSVAALLGKMITESDTGYAEAEWHIFSTYMLKGCDDILFLTVHDPVWIGRAFAFAYSVPQRRYYKLNGIDSSNIMDLLSNCPSDLESDGDIINFCRVMTLMKHARSYIRFIGDIKQLLLESVSLLPFASYDLESIRGFVDIPVELPTIRRNGDTVTAVYYSAIDDLIVKCSAVFEESNLISYGEEEVGIVPNWYGLDPRKW